MLLGRCLVCQEPWDDGPLCPSCRKRIEEQFFDSVCGRCPKCFAVLPFDGYRCRFCSEHPGFRLLVASPYEGLSAKLLERFKFFGMRKIAEVAGWVLRKHIDIVRRMAGSEGADAMGGAIGIGGAFASDGSGSMVPDSQVLVVPVPASPQGRRKRGFDQMELVAKAIGLPWKTALERVGAGEQKTLDRKGRLASSGGLFRAKADVDLSGRMIFVIDDITTTGATIMGAMKALGAPDKNIVGMVWMGGALR